MTNTKNIEIAEYDYLLPDEKIAKYPLKQRDSSKLLLYNGGNISHDTFSNLPQYIDEGTLMIFNNTKVIQARLRFKKETGAQIEVFCLEPEQPIDYQQTFLQTDTCVWKCLIGNSARWKNGMLSQKLSIDDKEITLHAERINSGAVNSVRFTWDGGVTFADVLDAVGELPIPPYLNRKTEEEDKKTYQTVYSKIKGSVAAPTAGLHFTGQTMSQLKEKKHTVARSHVARGGRNIQAGKERQHRRARNARRIYRGEKGTDKKPDSRERKNCGSGHYIGAHTRKPLLPWRGHTQQPPHIHGGTTREPMGTLRTSAHPKCRGVAHSNSKLS